MSKKFFKRLKVRTQLNIHQVSKKKSGTFVSKYKNVKLTDWEQNEKD